MKNQTGTLLKEGDVINIKNGMEVYSKIPEKFVYENKKLSNELTEHEIIIGEIYHSNPNLHTEFNELAEDLVEAFEFRVGVKLPRKTAILFVTTNCIIPDDQEFMIPEGEFVVIKTTFQGGGIAMFNDEYPDGHHVTCKQLKDGEYYEKGLEVSFYQTGSFSAMITPNQISAIRQMKQKFV